MVDAITPQQADREAWERLYEETDIDGGNETVALGILANHAQQARDEVAASIWKPVSEKPTLHQQVLVELKDGPGEVCDVACYVGKHQIEGGGQQDRWIMSDVRLDTRQIVRWAYIHPLPPRNEIAAAVEAERKHIESEMPTTWYDPAGKGYPCFERPMTASECRQLMDFLSDKIFELEQKLEIK